MLWTYEDEMKLVRGSAYHEGKKEGEKTKEKELLSSLLEKGVPIELLAEVFKLSKSQIQSYIRS